jgi:hypothetical protein
MYKKKALWPEKSNHTFYKDSGTCRLKQEFWMVTLGTTYIYLESHIDLLKKEFHTVLFADKVLISINVEWLGLD